MHSSIENLLANAADTIVGSWPRRPPAGDRLRQAKIVAHRGDCNSASVRENTLAAFDAAVAAGVWGLECDIRYSADGEPVISHDPDLRRVFGQPDVIATTPWSQLHARAPALVHLQDFLARYAGTAHLMLELKIRAPGRGETRLQQLLGGLEPATDFHILALDPQLFNAVPTLPARCHLPVATVNPRPLLAYALAHDCAGLAGHYLTLGRQPLRQLQAASRHSGSGQIPNRNVLWREISRGVTWLFSNHAIALQRALDIASRR